MEKSCHESEGRDGVVTLFDGGFKFRAKGNLYEQFAFRLTHGYVRNVMKDFGDDDHSSVGTDDETSPGGELAKAAVSAFRPVTSSVTTSMDIEDYHLVLSHLNARPLKNLHRSLVSCCIVNYGREAAVYWQRELGALLLRRQPFVVITVSAGFSRRSKL